MYVVSVGRTKSSPNKSVPTTFAFGFPSSQREVCLIESSPTRLESTERRDEYRERERGGGGGEILRQIEGKGWRDDHREGGTDAERGKGKDGVGIDTEEGKE